MNSLARADALRLIACSKFFKKSAGEGLDYDGMGGVLKQLGHWQFRL